MQGWPATRHKQDRAETAFLCPALLASGSGKVKLLVVVADLWPLGRCSLSQHAVSNKLSASGDTLCASDLLESVERQKKKNCAAPDRVTQAWNEAAGVAAQTQAVAVSTARLLTVVNCLQILRRCVWQRSLAVRTLRQGKGMGRRGWAGSQWQGVSSRSPAAATPPRRRLPPSTPDARSRCQGLPLPLDSCCSLRTQQYRRV